MGDYKYRALVTGETSLKKGMIEQQTQPIRSEVIRPIAAAFAANLDRTGYVQSLPLEIAFQVRRDEIFTTSAIFRLGGFVASTLDEVLTRLPSESITAEIKKQFEAFLKLPFEKHVQYRQIFGIRYVEGMLEDNEGMQKSIDAIFASIVLESWTSFECLAGDLWVSAIDNGPKEMAQKVQLSRHVKKQDDMSINDVKDNDFDPRSQYAAFLREARMVSFQTLSSIEKFYGVAFGKDATDLFLKTEDGYIYALSAVRNILAHKAGRVDKAFTKQCARFEELKGYAVGDPIRLDGELVKKLRRAATSLGVALIHFVDGATTPTS